MISDDDSDVHTGRLNSFTALLAVSVDEQHSGSRRSAPWARLKPGNATSLLEPVEVTVRRSAV